MSATTNLVVATAGTVIVGTWSQEKGLTARIFVGGAFLAVSLALIEQANETLAMRFALLIFVVAVFVYGPAIALRAGLISPRKYAKGVMA